MKKFAALSLASFDLLLTTGMHVSSVASGNSHLIELLALSVSPESPYLNGAESYCQAKSEKFCNGNEGCSCCKRHGTFAVKGKLDGKFQLLKISVLTESIAYFIAYTFGTLETNSDAWTQGNASPVVVKSPLYISYRTLLI